MELAELYLTLFLSFFKIGLFGFGGGYAMLPLIKNEVVDLHGWLTISDFTNIVAISQTTPGPIAFNSATFVGFSAVTQLGYSNFYGILGSAICTISVSLPSLIIITVVYKFFTKLKDHPYMRASLNILKPAIIGLIAAAALMLMNRDNFIDYKSMIIFVAVLLASLKKVDPILLIVISGIAGLLLYPI